MVAVPSEPCEPELTAANAPRCDAQEQAANETALEPMQVSESCIPSEAHNSLTSLEGGKPRNETLLRGFPPDEDLLADDGLAPIIGFDIEYVKETDEASDDEDDDGDYDEAEDRGEHNRILSYQFAGRFAGLTWSGIIYPEDDPRAVQTEYGPRLRFRDVIETALRQGFAAGVLRKWPKEIIATAHDSRADLFGMADRAEIIRQFDSVQKCYVSIRSPLKMKFRAGGRAREVAVSLVDTKLLAPSSGKALAEIGKLYNFSKLELGTVTDENGVQVPAIERMDLLKAQNRELFEAYGIRDAEIGARHVDEMRKFAAESLGITMVPLTIAGMGVSHLRTGWALRGLQEDFQEGDVLGFRMVERRKYIKPTKRFPNGRCVTYEIKEEFPKVLFHRTLATKCFHGGRNEAFFYGPTSIMDPAAWSPSIERYDFKNKRAVMQEAAWREYDVTSAYATAIASLGIPDWHKARVVKDAREFRADTMGFALVRFTFPDATRFPCLPVRDPSGHGLIYPLRGEAYATSPEIALALRLGASIEVEHGVIIPWKSGEAPPFRAFIEENMLRRNERKEMGDALGAEMFKLMNNALYGKLGQGLGEKKVFNTRRDEHVKVPPSAITNPFFAAYVTGLVRALVGELMASLHPRFTVLSVTTDGFITNAPISEISLTGPIALHLAAIRQSLPGGAGLLEVKEGGRQMLVLRTRCAVTLWASEGLKPKAAASGVRVPRSAQEKWKWLGGELLLRKPDSKWESEEPPSFSKSHIEDREFVYEKRAKRTNLEYDFKRRPVDVSPSYVPVSGDPEHIVQHISFNTVPWATVDEFVRERELFDEWHRRGIMGNSPGTLRTMTDWQHWESFKNGDRAAKHGVNRRGDVVGQTKRIFLRAYVHAAWGLPGGGYEVAAAALTKAGYPTTAQHFKDAMRDKRPIPEQAIDAETESVADFVRATVAIWPTFDWRKLVSGELELNPAAPAAALELPTLKSPPAAEHDQSGLGGQFVNPTPF